MASSFAPTLLLLSICAFTAQVSSQLDCTSESEVPETSSLSDTVHLLRTDNAEEARHAALCHVACVSFTFSDIFFEDLNTSGNGTNSTEQEATETPQGVLLPNCGELKTYLDCRTGCIAAAMGDSSCSDTCSGRCLGLCGFNFGCFGFQRNACGVGCDRGDCSQGCDLFSMLSSTPLPKSVAPPELIRFTDQWLYDTTIPSEILESEYSSVVFRIETQSGEEFYQWMVDIEYSLPDIAVVDFLLDLSVFVGQSINVSLAYATLDGFSAYSDLAQVHLFREVEMVFPSDREHAFVTSDPVEARMLALCHVECLAHVLQDESPLSGNGTMNGTLTSCSNDPMDMEGVILLDCRDQFRQYLDCRSGCIAVSNGVGCQTCSRRCRDVCNFRECFGCDGYKCGLDCDANECSVGCMLSPQIMSVVPMNKPTSPPELLRMERNVYDVIVPDELAMYDNPSFVFRIESQTGQIFYQWMIDVEYDLPAVTVFEDMLDLSSYAGQRLNIAYAYAIAGTSFTEYSETTVVEIPECVVREIAQDQVRIVSTVADPRQGFFSHYIMNVIWCPSPCTEKVSHYLITREGSSNNRCGGRVTVEVYNASTSSVLVMSNNPAEVALPCTVDVKVKTVLFDGTIVNGATVTRRLTVGMADYPTLTLRCPVTYDPLRQRYRVDFNFSAPFTAAILDQIDLFTYRRDIFRMQDGRFPSLEEGGQFIDNINPNIGETTYIYTDFVDPLEEVELFYILSIDVSWKPSVNTLPALGGNCRTFSTTVPPPLPVQNISIVDVDTQHVIESFPSGSELLDIRVAVTVNWMEPELMFTREPISGYEIYLGLEELESDAPAPGQLGTATGDTQSASLTRELKGIPKSQTTHTAYLQIRCRQFEDFPSDWSVGKDVVIVVLRRPDEVDDFEVTLTAVDVEHAGGGVLLFLDGLITWEAVTVQEGATLSYELSVGGSSRVLHGDAVSETITRHLLILAESFELDVEFSIFAVAEMFASTEGPPVTVNELFQPLPYPENIITTAINPRFIGAGSSYTLSADLTINWENPQFQTADIDNYEISFSDVALRAFDRFNKQSEDELISNDTTQFQRFISEDISVASPQLFVQMRSIVDGNINLLPQWSQPINVPLAVLPPPDIITSRLLSLNLTANSHDDFSVEVYIKLSWSKPEGGTEDMEVYEVWVGSVPLEEYKEASQQLGDIVPLEVDSVAAVTTDNATEPLLRIDHLSTSFFSTSDNGIVYIQMRSVSAYGIPKWSTPAVAHQAQAVPPPTNISVTAMVTNLDSDSKIKVEARVHNYVHI